MKLPAIPHYDDPWWDRLQRWWLKYPLCLIGLFMWAWLLFDRPELWLEILISISMGFVAVRGVQMHIEDAGPRQQRWRELKAQNEGFRAEHAEATKDMHQALQTIERKTVALRKIEQICHEHEDPDATDGPLVEVQRIALRNMEMSR